MALKQTSKQHTTNRPINKQEHGRGKDLGFTSIKGRDRIGSASKEKGKVGDGTHNPPLGSGHHLLSPLAIL
jgi:hypothetical protein